MWWPIKPKPPLDELQGNVLTPYRKLKCVAYTFVEIRSAEGGRQLLAGLLPEVTTEQANARSVLDHTLNIAVTYRGLVELGVADAVRRTFPEAFRQGMAARADRLADVRDSAPQNWEQPFRDEAMHILVVQYGTDRPAVEHLITGLRQRIAAIDGVTELITQECVRDGEPSESFGFRDGLAQPAIRVAGVDAASPKEGGGTPALFGRWRSVPLGEFVLGYRGADGVVEPPPAGPLGRNATYMVYRKLRQDIDGFRALVESGRDDFPDLELLEAKIVGRWPNGQPLANWPRNPPPHITAKRRLNDFRYGRDPVGELCPVGAHIRRANPRDATGAGRKLTQRHRIIRRGTPYVDAPSESGLIFVCFNADIERQFEFIQRMWLNDGDALGLGSDPDPIAGHWAPEPGRVRRFVVPGDRPVAIALPAPVVTTRGGAYLLVPSMDALKRLSEGTI